MQLEQPSKSLDDFNLAAALDENNSDVYHHRGQVTTNQQQNIFNQN